MTPPEFFDEFVEGNARDYREEPGSVRRAFNAAVSASHLADHVHEYSTRHAGELASRFPDRRDYLDHLGRETNGAFIDVRSIANVFKHLYRSPNAVHCSTSSAGAIVSAKLGEDAKDLVTRLEECGIRIASVSFTRRDGSTQAFLPVLDTVVDYWRERMYRDAEWLSVRLTPPQP